MNFTIQEVAGAVECRSINDLVGGINKCNFLKENDECLSDDSVFDYMYMAFCIVDSSSYIKPIALSAFLFLLLFISLGVTADDFLCPSLLVISKTLGISQNIAGVTLLAFGNGSPDIFSSLAGIKQTRPELVIGELFGSGIFVTMVVVGSIFLCKSFTTMRRPIIRDMIFYMFACFFAWATVWHGSISFYHAMVFIFIYIIYLVTVILGRFINQKLKKKKEEKKKQEAVKSTNEFQFGKKYETNKISHHSSTMQHQTGRSMGLDIENNQIMTNTADLNYNTIQNPDQSNSNLKSVLIANAANNNKFGIDNPSLDVNDSLAGGRRLSYSVHHHFDNTVYHIAHSVDLENELACTNPACDCSRSRQDANDTHLNAPNQTNLNRSRKTNISISSDSNNSLPNFESQSIVSSFTNLRNLNEFQDFLIHICPLDLEEWKNSSIFIKLYQLFRAPIYFLLVITIPVIDYENDRHNWSRILGSIHLITAPLTILYITGVYVHIVESWTFLIATGVACVLASLLVFFFTTNKKEPRFHHLYGYLGFLVSMLWIYALANETISLLHVIGIMLNLSDFILGLTILAFGNSIGDLMSNISMARNGFARMGISACYGGPLFNLLFGIGLPYCIVLYGSSESLKINYSKIVTLSFGTVTFGLTTTLFLLIFSNFHTKKWHGAILLVIYVFYVTTAILIETNHI